MVLNLRIISAIAYWDSGPLVLLFTCVSVDMDRYGPIYGRRTDTVSDTAI